MSETPLPADRYLDREISWLQFNDRVLDLARDRKRIPLIERAKFLAIFSSNLDEFFMVRVAGLKRRIAAGVAVPTVNGKMPGELHSFADLVQEARTACPTWQVVFISTLSGQDGQPPTTGRIDAALGKMVEGVRAGAIQPYMALDTQGEPLLFT